MKKLTNLYCVALISCGLSLMGCSDSLKSQFDACYTKKSNPNELLNHSKLKGRIIKGYSQQYYEKLLECSKIYSPVYFDSIQNCYRLYAWKEHKYKNENSVRLRYYIDKDSVAINLYVDDVEIDKSGYTDYPNLDKLTDNDMKTVENLANKGFATAQAYLGVCYAGGNVVEKDKEKALLWINKAAMQNLSAAQYVRAILEEDEKIGVEWLQKSAEQDNTTALMGLANLYISGEVLPKDYTKALKIYQHAARFDTDAQFKLGYVYLNNDLLDTAKAIQWFTTAAENGNDKAQYALGGLYSGILNDKIVSQDFNKAIYWFTKASEQGRGDASYLISYIYFQEDMPGRRGYYEPIIYDMKKAIAQNTKEGLEWLIKAANQGYEEAFECLGQYYYQEMDIPNAIEWFRKSKSNYSKRMLKYLGGN